MSTLANKRQKLSSDNEKEYAASSLESVNDSESKIEDDQNNSSRSDQQSSSMSQENNHSSRNSGLVRRRK